MQVADRYVESEGVFGSSTCCLVTINENTGLLQSANVGDSGFMVIGKRGESDKVSVMLHYIYIYLMWVAQFIEKEKCYEAIICEKWEAVQSVQWLHYVGYVFYEFPG